MELVDNSYDRPYGKGSNKTEPPIRPIEFKGQLLLPPAAMIGWKANPLAGTNYRGMSRFETPLAVRI